MIRAKFTGQSGWRNPKISRAGAPGRGERRPALTTMQTHRVWIETVQRRDDARALLETLLAAKRCSERNLAEMRRSDLVKQVTGKSSMDNAIESTRRLIASFDRVLEDLKATLGPEEIELLDEVMA